LLVGDHALVAGLALPENGDFVLAMGKEVAVDAIVRGIDLATHEPLGKRRIPFENVGPLLEPGKFLLGQGSPKLFGILRRPLVQLAVAFHSLNQCILDETRTGGIYVGHGRILTHVAPLIFPILIYRIFSSLTLILP